MQANAVSFMSSSIGLKRLRKQAGLDVFLAFVPFRIPLIYIQVAFTRGFELDAFGFEDLLLEVHRDGEAARGAFALGVDHPLPRDIVVGPVHYVADRSGSVAFAEDGGDLAVGHHASRRDLPDDGVDAFAVLFVVDYAHPAIGPGRQRRPTYKAWGEAVLRRNPR